MNRRDLVRAVVGAIALRYAPLAHGIAPSLTYRACVPPLEDGIAHNRAKAPGFGIVANVATADHVFRAGTRLQVHQVPGDRDRARVSGVSRGGRRVVRWLLLSRIANPRIRWVSNVNGIGAPERDHHTLVAALADLRRDIARLAQEPRP